DMLGNWVGVKKDLDGNGNYTGTGESESRTHNQANELGQRTIGSLTLPFTYDPAGNVKVAQRTGATEDVFTHDAWNRLVRQEVRLAGGGQGTTLVEHEYNGLHWRVKKSVAGDGSYDPPTPDQDRVMYYSAAWQLLEERIDEDGAAGDDRIAQEVWGIRYIDDPILRRQRSGSLPQLRLLREYHVLELRSGSALTIREHPCICSCCGSIDFQ
ncbi:MAG: hypothetical protein ACKVW3_18290, partial [Phycisphaerales bacterium]